MPYDINSWMMQLLDRLQQSRQRQLVTFQGPKAWCDNHLADLDLPILVLSNRNLSAETISFKHAETCLGSEANLVAMDLFEGFNADVFCIASGLVKAGGVLLLFSPRVADWEAIDDRYARWQDQTVSQHSLFVEYFFSALAQHADIGILFTPQTISPPIPPQKYLQATPILSGMTSEQSNSLQSIEQWFTGNHQGIVMITADRGRGKSTCLGLLANHLLEHRQLKILVSAASRQAAAQLLKLASDVEFIAPDRLIESCPQADLLIIDEVAMIPQSMLRQICRLYSRIVMATTTGGYEGTGQGFMLRFVAGLKQLNLLHLTLHDPVRWCSGDDLEAWINHNLLLEHKPVNEIDRSINLQACELRLFDEPGKPENIPILCQLYSLLSSAHYRTRPSDLRMLMENPDLLLITAEIEGQLVGAAMLNKEGGLDAELCDEIFLGNRRPKGHLLAQMLTAQAGVENFAGFRGLRIQRIAVAESHRRLGLGTQLIERARQYAQVNGFDWLGASFALDAELSKFWRKCGFSLVHVSFAQGKSSGNHSVAVVLPVAHEIDSVMGKLQQRIQQQLGIWMTQFLQTMEANSVVALLRYAKFQTSLSDLEMREIDAFTRGQKGFELCFASLQKFVMQQIARTSIEVDDLLIEKAVQNRKWDMLRDSGSDGRKQLQQRLRELVDGLCKA